jgi:hypothetical protein
MTYKKGEPMSNVTREYKDRLFTFIFGYDENREWTLSLYNAVNGSHYTDPSLIQFTTIRQVLYLGMHNDVSFLISDEMNCYEQQSTYCPNMPLRMLQYLSDLYERYVTENHYRKHGTSRILLPKPKLVVFYNGTAEQPKEKTDKLSDAFIGTCSENDPDAEILVRMININHGKNPDFLQTCKPLYEYSWFVEETRKNMTVMKDIDEAVDMAIDAMPNDFQLKHFLTTHRREVGTMLLTEYNEEEELRLSRLEGERLGLEKGKRENREENIVSMINSLRCLDLDTETIKTGIIAGFNLTKEEIAKYFP